METSTDPLRARRVYRCTILTLAHCVYRTMMGHQFSLTLTVHGAHVTVYHLMNPPAYAFLEI